MNDTITQVRSLDQDRQLTLATDTRITLADRLSVRIGLWLLLRAERRIERHRDVDVHARFVEAARAREAHERTVLQAGHSVLRMY